jgi:hypothetical protein
VALGMRAYHLATSLLISLIDLWTLCSVTDSLQDGGLSGVCSSNNEHSELDIIGLSGIVPRQIRRGLSHLLITTVARRGLVTGLGAEYT